MIWSKDAKQRVWTLIYRYVDECVSTIHARDNGTEDEIAGAIVDEEAAYLRLDALLDSFIDKDTAQ